MNAIMTRVSTKAISDMNESGNFRSINDTMRDHAEGIKDRSIMIYTLYEMCNVFGIHKYSPRDVEMLTKEIFYEK